MNKDLYQVWLANILQLIYQSHPYKKACLLLLGTTHKNGTKKRSSHKN